MQRIEVIDSHTGGEPTRVVISGGPTFPSGTVAERLAWFRREHDRWRSAVVNEPRGSDVLVGAWMLPPSRADCVAGVFFFNNVGYLGMCGHGAIGLIATLAHLGRIAPGDHRLETPVGVVTATLHNDGRVSIVNVPSYRKHRRLMIDVPKVGPVIGDVAWGGNWFFLTHSPQVGGTAIEVEISHVAALVQLASKIRAAVNAQGFPEVDHVEFFGPARIAAANAKNFVLCPGGAYDRSPCGTGTSAKLACLAADGELDEGEVWVQESIVGSTFAGSYRWLDREAGTIEPTITGMAFVTAEATLVVDDRDAMTWGWQGG